MNEDILAEALEEMIPLWGTRKTYVIPPSVDESDPEHPRLPPVRFTAWLTCYRPVVETYAGSELVVVWFREECDGVPIDQVIHEGVRAIPWEEVADDFAGW
jgi:hypothetical protein